MPGVAGYGTVSGPREISTGYKNDPINGTRNSEKRFPVEKNTQFANTAKIILPEIWTIAL
jgi:hypothetical protein